MQTEDRLSVRKRAAIVDAAVTQFLERGFEGASMDRIAQEAKVSKRTVYNHFPSKDHLFEEIVERLKSQADAAVALPYEHGLPLAPQLHRYARAVCDFYCSREARRLTRILVSRFLDQPQLAAASFGQSKMFETILCDWIATAMTSQRLNVDEPRFAAKQLLAILESFTLWPPLLKNAPVPRAAERDRIAQGASEMFLARYATRPRDRRFA
jgi:TetR/AcrR family transcriptional regulator of autoinduction and epiphytic fitness